MGKRDSIIEGPVKSIDRSAWLYNGEDRNGVGLLPYFLALDSVHDDDDPPLARRREEEEGDLHRMSLRCCSPTGQSLTTLNYGCMSLKPGRVDKVTAVRLVTIDGAR